MYASVMSSQMILTIRNVGTSQLHARTKLVADSEVQEFSWSWEYTHSWAVSDHRRASH